MKKAIILLILIFISCSKDDGIKQDINKNPSMSLTPYVFNSYSATFLISSSNIDNLKLIWGESTNLDIKNKEGEKTIDLSSKTVVIQNLSPNKKYYFRLYSQLEYLGTYSDIASVTTARANVTFDKALLSGKPGTFQISKIKQVSDGFIIGTKLQSPSGSDTSIEILKLDNNLNVAWNLNINESPNTDDLAEIYDLQNGDIIISAKKFDYTRVGTYNHQLYCAKISSTGSVKWLKYFNYKNTEDFNYWYNVPLRYEVKPGQLKILAAVDTTYYKNEDAFKREFEIDTEGNLISNKIFGTEYTPYFMNVTYDQAGNKFNYGGRDFNPNDGLTSTNAFLEKYDNNNNLVWTKNFGNTGTSYYFDKIVLGENKIACIGKKANENGANGESKWVVQNDANGTIVWDYKTTRPDFLYQGKDIFYENQNELIALSLDIYYPHYHAYNYASVIKLDNMGNLIWEFRDGEDFNDDNFVPSNIYKIKDEYILIGSKDGIIWGKKFKM